MSVEVKRFVEWAPAARKYLLYILPVIVIVVSVAASLALSQRGSYKKSLQQSRTQLQQVNQQLQAIPSPSKIVAGQLDLSVPYMLEQLNAADELNAKTSLKLPNSRLLTLSLRLKGKSVPVPLNRTYRGAQTATQAIDQLLDHQAAVMGSVQKVLEYNPVVDFGSNLDDASKAESISAARGGIKKSLEGLKAAKPYPYDDLSATTKTMEQLLDDLATFEKTQDAANWYKSVNDAQQSLIKDRAMFWDTALARRIAELRDINAQLADIEFNL